MRLHQMNDTIMVMQNLLDQILGIDKTLEDTPQVIEARSKIAELQIIMQFQAKSKYFDQEGAEYRPEVLIEYRQGLIHKVTATEDISIWTFDECYKQDPAIDPLSVAMIDNIVSLGNFAEYLTEKQQEAISYFQ